MHNMCAINILSDIAKCNGKTLRITQYQIWGGDEE